MLAFECYRLDVDNRVRTEGPCIVVCTMLGSGWRKVGICFVFGWRNPCMVIVGTGCLVQCWHNSWCDRYTTSPIGSQLGDIL
jgi:hypothetical protein